jgi:hypothetical protein
MAQNGERLANGNQSKGWALLNSVDTRYGARYAQNAFAPLRRRAEFWKPQAAEWCRIVLPKPQGCVNPFSLSRSS